MCGIACIVDRDSSDTITASLERMNRQAVHRGPDGSGFAVFGPVGFGHTRLSIIDLSDAARQPMSRQGTHITFNGEIYNFVELRGGLQAAGHTFQTSSDTEVLLRVIQKWGMGGLDRLKGMFAFAYYNEQDHAIFLARDRFGKKPLVYTRQNGVFYAASEVKQILAVLQSRPRMNVPMALRYLEFGYLNGTAETFFSDIYEVPAGHYLRFDIDGGNIDVVRWYDISKKIYPVQENYEQARERVRELLQASVRRRHVADVEVGACLSGGIDSSSIVSLSSSLFPDKRLRTITSFSNDAGYDERQYSRRVVQEFGVDSIEIEPQTGCLWQPEFQSSMAFYQEQPMAGGSQLNEHYVFKAAHDAGLKVMLDGQGADEYFGGYGEFWFSAQLELLRSGRLKDLRAGLLARAEAQKQSFRATLLNFLSAARMRTEMAKQTRSAEWLKCHAGHEPQRRQGKQSFRDLSVEELCRSSVPFQVHSEDRNSMRWSVESRLPFLDHELVEYVLNLPTAFKCRRGVQKAILRDAVQELPADIAGRRDKIGFASPDAKYFFRDSTRIRAALRDAVARLYHFIESEPLMGRFDHIVKRGSGYDRNFFRILGLDGWIRAFDATF